MAGNLNKLPQRKSVTPELHRLKNRMATLPGLLTVVGAVNCTSNTTVAAGINLLHSAPLYSQGGTIYSISFEVTTGGAAGSVARAGIYANTEEPNMYYPGKLLFDTGEISATGTGVKTTVCNNLMVPGGLSCWCVYHAGVAAPTVRCVAVGATYGECVSQTNLSTVYTCISTSRTYAALPHVYPWPIAHGSNTVFPLMAVSWEK